MAKLKSFSQFNKIVKKVFESNAVNFQQDFTSMTGGEIAEKTPIKTGKATGNWTGSINSSNTTDKRIFDRSISASPTKKKIQFQVSKSKLGDDLYISNGVKGADDGGGYIIQLEHGKSNQAPNGMALITVARSNIIAKKALKL